MLGVQQPTAAIQPAQTISALPCQVMHHAVTSAVTCPHLCWRQGFVVHDDTAEAGGSHSLHTLGGIGLGLAAGEQQRNSSGDGTIGVLQVNHMAG